MEGERWGGRGCKHSLIVHSLTSYHLRLSSGELEMGDG